MAKVQPRRNLGKFYMILGAIVVVAGIAIAYNTRPPKQDLFQVDPNAPPIEAVGYLMGNPDAPVRIREWADFECPTCVQFATVTEPDVRRLVESGQVSFEYFFFPLVEIHQNAASSAYAAACAADQGIDKFWAMHDAIYQGYDEWGGGRTRNARGVFKKYAERIGLDVGAWESCFDSDKFHDLIAAHRAEGIRLGVNGTPTFMIGDVMVAGGVPYDRIKAVVDSVAQLKGVVPGAAVADSAAAAPR